MLYGSHHEIVNISNPDGRERFYSVVGYICETDTFGSNRKIAEISEGEYLAFKNAGAYCQTMASNYNSRYRPAEIFWINNEAHLFQARKLRGYLEKSNRIRHSSDQGSSSFSLRNNP